MAIIQITLTFDAMNVSCQVGDIAYYSSNAQSLGGFEKSTVSNTKRLGEILEINGSSITVQFDDTVISGPGPNDFISFVKDKTINTTSLLGYYAKVKFINNSIGKIELFSVGSEIDRSSK